MCAFRTRRFKKKKKKKKETGSGKSEAKTFMQNENVCIFNQATTIETAVLARTTATTQPTPTATETTRATTTRGTWNNKQPSPSSASP